MQVVPLLKKYSQARIHLTDSLKSSTCQLRQLAVVDVVDVFNTACAQPT